MGDARRAVVLLSGGIDSATALAIARAEGFEAHALTARYGQRHAREVEAARRVARQLGAREHRVVDLDPALFLGSVLTGGAALAADDRDDARDPPPTYVPARNTVLLAVALAWAESLGARDLFVGANVLDRDGYPDCRPAFFEAFERLANLGTRDAFAGHLAWRVRTPLADLTKAGVIARGLALGVDYGLTWSCYAPSDAGRPCEACGACAQRRAGFMEVGVVDPVRVAARCGP